MANALILAVDQGTTNTKALLVDRDGHTVFRASAPLELLLPSPGYVEQDTLALWQSVCHVMDECVRYAAGHDASISGIAITNQRETSLVWRPAHADFPATDKPLSNAISWQCRRSAPVCDRLRPHASTIQGVTGLPLDPLLSATKWAWLLEHQPAIRAAADAGELLLGTVDSWLLYNLTGGSVHATGLPNAIAQVSVGQHFACAVSAADERVYCWDKNNAGQLGRGVVGAPNDPEIDASVPVVNLTAKQVATGTDHACAVATDNSVQCWGDTTSGQLGDGTNSSNFVPTPQRGESMWDCPRSEALVPTLQF